MKTSRYIQGRIQEILFGGFDVYRKNIQVHAQLKIVVEEIANRLSPVSLLQHNLTTVKQRLAPLIFASPY